MGNNKLDFISLSIAGLDCNQICEKIQKLVNDYVESGRVIDNSLLDIRISNVSCTIEPELPKIEKHNITES